MATMAAVDLGAQSGRVALGWFDGETLAVTETHRFANEPVSSAGVLRWNVDDLRRNVLDGLRAAARETAVDSVAVDSWGVDFGLVDSDDRLLEDPVHYRDGRRAEAFATAFERVPARELYGRTGIQLLPINTIFELAALAAERSPALAAADRILLMPDLFHHWLCGSRTTELTNATTTQCYDPVEGRWAGDLLERLEIRTDVFPEVVAPGTLLGAVTAETADETGLGKATVVAAATHDTGSAVAAAPFARPGSIFLSVGTWSLVGVELDEPLINDETFAANLTNEGGVAGTTRLLRTSPGSGTCTNAAGLGRSRDRRFRSSSSSSSPGRLRRSDRSSSRTPISSSSRGTCRSESPTTACRQPRRARPVSARRSGACWRAWRSSTRRRSTCSDA
jgi:rhamnulokinase